MCRDNAVIAGEWLYSQGKGRQFKPGSGKQLAEYLTAVCPLDLSNRPLSTSFDDNLVKVLQKRNQYLNESLTSSGTEYMHDSFSLGHHQKENRAPLSSDRCSSATMTATPSTVLSPRQESVAEEDKLDVSNESVKNAYDAYDERSAVANFPSSFPTLQQQHDVFHSHVFITWQEKCRQNWVHVVDEINDVTKKQDYVIFVMARQSDAIAGKGSIILIIPGKNDAILVTTKEDDVFPGQSDVTLKQNDVACCKSDVSKY
uniref:Uncharacterized protein n=1 Tax=Plectus sambesii TaxID=2011161 RepID=A0A914XA99_9BILA